LKDSLIGGAKVGVFASTLLDFLGGEALFFGAGLAADIFTALRVKVLIGFFGTTDLERWLRGATEADLLTLAILTTALRAAFTSRLRRGAALVGLLLLERVLLGLAAAFGVSFFFWTVTLRIIFGGDAIFLSFYSTLTVLIADFRVLIADFRVLIGETDFLGGETDALGLD
jgi:hypothetical protein